MKTFRKIVAMGALTLTLAACSESELYLMGCGCQGTGQTTPLKVTEVTRQGYSLTKSITGKETFTVGDAIGLWIDEGVSSTYNGVQHDNLRLDKKEEGWELSKDVALTKTAATVYAFYPYDAEMEGTTVTLQLNDDTDYLQDVVTGISNTSPSVSLSMKHLRAKLVVRIHRGTYAGAGQISSGTISGSSLSVNGTYDLKTRKFASTDGISSVSMTGTVTGSDMLEEEWYVFSKFGTALSPLSFTFTIDGTVFPTVSSQESIEFEGGKKYIYDITLNNHVATVTAVTIEPWGSGVDEDVTITD